MLDDGESNFGVAKGTFEIYRAEGELLCKQGEYRKARDSYDMALEMKAEDKDCLVSRSKCYLQMGDAKMALEDAEKALAEDKDFNRGIACKAEALYHLGNFERALVFYHRGHKLRPEQQEFRLGIQKSQEAIDNSIGDPKSVKLRADGDLSFFWEAQQEDKPAKKKAGGGRYRKPGQAVVKQEKQRPKNQGSNVRDIKQLLGKLCNDYDFLGKIYEDEDNNNRSTKTSSTIQKLALDAINYLDSRTEFWRQQKPMYSRKRDKEIRDARRNSSKGARGDAAKYMLKNLEEIDQAQTEMRYDDALKQSKTVLKTVEKWTDADVPNRDEVIANLHSCMGNSYLEKGEFEKSVKHHQKDLALAEEHDLPDAKSRAMDNLGRVYARMGKFDEAIDIWNDKVPLSKSALETTWLYHEIGRCHLELGQHGKAKDFGEKSLAAAQEAEDDVWQLNASVLIAQSEVKSEDYQSAVDSFERSLEMAKAQGDSEAEKAIRKALEDVNEKIVKGLKGEDVDEKEEKDKKSESDNENATNGEDADDTYDQDFEDCSPREQNKDEKYSQKGNDVHERTTESAAGQKQDGTATEGTLDTDRTDRTDRSDATEGENKEDQKTSNHEKDDNENTETADNSEPVDKPEDDNTVNNSENETNVNQNDEDTKENVGENGVKH